MGPSEGGRGSAGNEKGGMGILGALVGDGKGPGGSGTGVLLAPTEGAEKAGDAEGGRGAGMDVEGMGVGVGMGMGMGERPADGAVEMEEGDHCVCGMLIGVRSGRGLGDGVVVMLISNWGVGAAR